MSKRGMEESPYVREITLDDVRRYEEEETLGITNQHPMILTESSQQHQHGIEDINRHQEDQEMLMSLHLAASQGYIVGGALYKCGHESCNHNPAFPTFRSARALRRHEQQQWKHLCSPDCKRCEHWRMKGSMKEKIDKHSHRELSSSLMSPPTTLETDEPHDMSSMPEDEETGLPPEDEAEDRPKYIEEDEREGKNRFFHCMHINCNNVFRHRNGREFHERLMHSVDCNIPCARCNDRKQNQSEMQSSSLSSTESVSMNSRNIIYPNPLSMVSSAAASGTVMVSSSDHVGTSLSTAISGSVPSKRYKVQDMRSMASMEYREEIPTVQMAGNTYVPRSENSFNISPLLSSNGHSAMIPDSSTIQNRIPLIPHDIAGSTYTEHSSAENRYILRSSHLSNG